ncbi:MAG: DUF1566 domain-containing protein [Desulfobacterales bacterium]|nr:DUF1566 domain-containing protein [Desulfobacterales bacterium]
MSMKMMSMLALLVMTLISLPVKATCNDNMALSTPDSRFSFSDSGQTVTDNQTGLIWAKCTAGFSGSDCATDDPGVNNVYNWQEALDFAAISTLAGQPQGSWRLPNFKELSSIVEIACSSPSINTTYFPDTPNSTFWSASPYAVNSGYAWVVGFNNGNGSSYGRDSGNYVRLVRGGQ